MTNRKKPRRVRRHRCVECGHSYAAYKMHFEEGAAVCWPSCHTNEVDALKDAREKPWPELELQKPDGALPPVDDA